MMQGRSHSNRHIHTMITLHRSRHVTTTTSSEACEADDADHTIEEERRSSRSPETPLSPDWASQPIAECRQLRQRQISVVLQGGQPLRAAQQGNFRLPITAESKARMLIPQSTPI